MGIFYLGDEKFKRVQYYNLLFFKRFKLVNLSFWLMDMYILTKG